MKRTPARNKKRKTLAATSLTVRERKAVREFAQRVRKKLPTQLVTMLLFGSKARGDSRADSDIDIFLLVKKSNKTTNRGIVDAADAVYWKYDVMLSPIEYDLYEQAVNLEIGSPFFISVYSEGITF